MTHSPSHPPTSVPDLGMLLRRHRQAAGLTQEELAELAGISARAVSDIERGLRTGIYRDTADRLAGALRLEPEARAGLLEAARRPTAASAIASTLPPAPPTPLHGRQAELEAIAQLIDAGGRRLVTLVGPPGVGKSRLALAAAHSAAAAARLSWFVPLAPISAAAAVPSAVLRTLELPDTGDAIERISRRLPAGSLLVLDNFEHVLDAAPWLADLLAAVPPMTVLVTSRAPLRLLLEQQVVVEPLAPEPALDLFRERVATLAARADWDDADQALAKRICSRLDRLPLALELGAAALSHLTLASLAEGLDQHLDVLGEGRRDMPSRHRSVRDAVTWSAELLRPADRELLRTVSVFAGTFGIDAVAKVAATDKERAIRGLARLVEQSLVRVGGELAGWPRYELLEVVRQAAREEALAAGELLTYRQRHLEHFVTLAEGGESALHSGGRAEWAERLLADLDNLEAALDFAAERGEADLGLRLATALWRWWRQRGALNSGRAHFRRLLALPGGTAPVRARALWGASWLALHQQDKDESRSLNEALLELATQTGDGLARRNALTGLGMVLRYEGKPDESLPLFREAVELAREAGDPWIHATSIFNVGQPLLETGALAEGEQLLEDARRRYLELGDAGFAARLLLYRARAAVLAREPGRAAAHFVGAADTFTELGEQWGLVECLEVGAAILALVGRDNAAAAALGTAGALHASLGSAPLGPDAQLVEPIFEAARTRSGPAWPAAAAAGAERSLGEALELLIADLRDLT